MNLPAAIKEILFTRGSVLIPGLGRLYTTHNPARIDKQENILIPPVRIIEFDAQIVLDDGKLSGFLQNKYKQNEHAVNQTISSFVEAVKNHLVAKGIAAIEGLGELKTSDSGLIFQSYSRGHPYADILPSIEIPASVKKESIAPKTTVPSYPTVKKSSRSISIPWIPITVLIVILGAAAAIYFTGIYNEVLPGLFGNRGEESVLFDDENKIVFGRPPADTDSLQAEVSRHLDELTSKERALSYQEPEVQTEISPLTETVVPAGSEAITPAGPYHIIAGSFLVPNNAQRQKTQLEKQGYSPVVLPPSNTYYMVSLGSYETIVQATQAMEQFRLKLDIQLWIKKI